MMDYKSYLMLILMQINSDIEKCPYSKKNECDNCHHHDGCYLSFLYDETSERIANQNERFPAKKAKKEDGNGI